MATRYGYFDVFYNLSTTFSNLLYGRTEGDRSLINSILDELNSLDYRQPVVANPTKAVLLINQCCTLIPPDDTVLVGKCCTLVTNLLNCQHVQIEGRTLSVVNRWIISALKQCDQSVTCDILKALDALLKSSLQNAVPLLSEILCKTGPLIALAQNEENLEILYYSVQCFETCAIISDNISTCTDVFLKYLINETSTENNLFYYKLLISCLKGLQHVTVRHHDYLNKEIGLLLGISRSYMLYKIKGIDFLQPQKVLPSTLNVAEASTTIPIEKKGGKVAKQRKPRNSHSKKDITKLDTKDWNQHFTGYIPASPSFSLDVDNVLNLGNRSKTSDSDFSDSDNSRMAALGIAEGKVREAALSLLLNVVKLTEKRTMFCYWSSFIPDSTLSASHSLTSCILRDPSRNGRMTALNVLLTLLASSKLYLSQAESSEKNTAFTPFSIILGSMVVELHRCLSLALNENSIPVLIQALKCLASLVQATPYYRLKQGIVTKVVRNVKLYIKHKDTNVQVGTLIVLGCVLASEPLTKEMKEVFSKHNVKKKTSGNETCPPNNFLPAADEIEFVNFSSDEEEESVQSSPPDEIPWLLERCLENLGVNFDKEPDFFSRYPVKLESLQVISAMCRNHFPSLVAPHLNLITKALEASLADKYTELRLHAGRTIDFIGQAMNQYFNNQDSVRHLSVEQALSFWMALINEPLVSLLSDEHSTLRAIGCDCVGSIGTSVFEQLPRDKQVLIVTQLLTCSRDDENGVKGAAVRALAISVLHPSLREDLGFIVDTTETILRTLQDDNVTVRLKASWSLGNLSDALILNRQNPDVEEISNNFLLKLLQVSVQSSKDNDKIKTNIVRAIGNLLQLITDDLICLSEFKETVTTAIAVLVKNATTGSNMKGRWNSCYAIGSVLKNSSLYVLCNEWQNSVFSALTDLVITFRNFKVRINAAVALAAPVSKVAYGSYYYSTWTAFLKALENSQNIEDFNEYKHRDNLVEQICLGIGHLAVLLEKDDLLHIHDSIIYHLDFFKLQMRRVLERLIPEKSTVLLTAGNHILNLSKQKHLTPEQQEILKILIGIFVNDLF